MKSWVTVSAAVLVAAAVAACSDNAGSTSAGMSCANHARLTTTPSSRDVSFAREVLPILQASCSFASCHGTPNRNGMYVGAQGGGADPSAIRDGLLKTPGASQTKMPLVTPGDTNKSWLLRKLEGDFCGVDCTSVDCGAQMPKNDDPLPASALDTIQTWVANGAPDN